MAVTDYLLYRVAKVWPAPIAVQQMTAESSDPTNDAYAMSYALQQYTQKVNDGFAVSPVGLEVLEIGCGHGGITCYLAAVGAKHVTGIDLDTKRLAIAKRFAEQLSDRLGRTLPITLAEMDASALNLPDASIDLVVADNVFEHFMNHEAVLREVMRVLRPGGKLLVPVFPSIYSKYGLHLKHGLKLPWANLLFSEKTICRAVQRMAQDNPHLYEIYPGLINNPTRVRDVRRYGDLNGMTYNRFRRDASKAGFKINWFRPIPTRAGKFFWRAPWLRDTIVMDVLSKGASCLLVKPVVEAARPAHPDAQLVVSS
jgi:ubiquinone/menaquinone biosynthesis C-methylase UbiE